MALTPYAAAYARLKALKKKAGDAKFTGVKPSLLLYGGVGMIALLKDLLDLAIGIIPGVVTVVAFCLTFFIWMLLFLFDRSGARTNKKMTQGIILLGVALFEGVGIGFNYIPLETFSVILLYILANRAYKKAQKLAEIEGAAENRRLIQEMRALERDEARRIEGERQSELKAANDERYDKKDMDMRKVA